MCLMQLVLFVVGPRWANGISHRTNTIMRTAHYNVETSIQLEVERFEEDRRINAWEAEQQAKADRARCEWWKAWECKVQAKRAGMTCILSAPRFAGHRDWMDVEF